jgi:hypothetical protein
MLNTPALYLCPKWQHKALAIKQETGGLSRVPALPWIGTTTCGGALLKQSCQDGRLATPDLHASMPSYADSTVRGEHRSLHRPLVPETWIEA